MTRIALLALVVLVAGFGLGGLARRGVFPGGTRPPAAAPALDATRRGLAMLACLPQARSALDGLARGRHPREATAAPQR